MKAEWQRVLSTVYGGDMKVYLASAESRKWCVDEYISCWLKRQMANNKSNTEGGNAEQFGDNFRFRERERESMRIYLAGKVGEYGRDDYIKRERERGVVDIAILESFAYVDEWVEKMIPLISDFILDSGAFTYMAGKDASKVNWEDYIERYANFINKNNVEKFIELDIDSIVGYERVKELRKLLIAKTGKQPIPVWHKSRGKEEFIKMCQEFPYVAIGGIVTKEIKRDEYRFFPWFIETAHKYGAKIHGLGLTNLEAIKKYHFDSVDSSSWTCGNRFGMIYKFTGNTIKQFTKPEGTRLSNAKEVAENNFNEWVKFQKYAKKFL